MLKDIKVLEEELGFMGDRDIDSLVISEHAIDRYVERLKGIEEINTRNRYIIDHKEDIKNFIRKTFQWAELVYAGEVGGNTNNNYYLLNGNIALVFSPKDNTIVTLFRVKFDVPDEDVSEAIISSYKKAIRLEQEKLNKLTLERNEIFTNANLKMKDNDIEIAKLEKMIDVLKNENAILKNQCSMIDNRINVAKSELKALATKLFTLSGFKMR